MAKVDKSQYTKQEWLTIKTERRAQKEAKRLVKTREENKKDVFNPTLDVPEHRRKAMSEKNYILCLKHGTKYSYEYVNTLHNMCKRHCTIPFEMVCLTDDPEGLHEDIKVIPLPDYLNGWWCKPYMYSKELPLKGTILYMDLDVVIANNIDKLFTYEMGKWCVIRDFTRCMRPKWNRYNSSIVRFRSGQLNNVWEKFRKDYKNIQRRFHGDQDWLWEVDKHGQLWPDEWIRSWKWEVRKSREFAPGGVKGARKMMYIENVVPKKECCIAVFHGDPNPALCEDPWVLENWY